MHKVMIAGAGKIGSMIACLLTNSEEYEVHLADRQFSGGVVTHLLQALPAIKTVVLDLENQHALQNYLEKYDISAIVSSLPFFLNLTVAKAAKKTKTHYFDLTEDINVTEAVKTLAKGAKTAFVPQCGLAPGFISIVAHSLLQEFSVCHHGKLRVGALPARTSNALHYSLTWSTEGIINEYSKLCQGIEKGKITTLRPLEDLETIQIEGCEYEAFNTSGGLGSLAELYKGKITSLNYKTIRYPGHCEKMRLLLQGLQLEEDPGALKKLLEKVIPKTLQDCVIIYVSAEGLLDGELTEKSYVKKMYPQTIYGLEWSAIQVSTAASVCAVVDLVLADPTKYHGLVLQEKFSMAAILANRFGHYYC